MLALVLVENRVAMDGAREVVSRQENDDKDQEFVED
jgi:hypothetical protein